ncbi:hypothetical protein V8G54_015242 [Vigna mungo]|uniref:Peroxisomal membrane protein PEX14 n=1 Tax=Vigna mungo TaxID=3915 RepID=A0AAQ3RY86_VIGMU
MATQSPPPPSTSTATDENKGSETAQLANMDQQNTREAEPPKPSSTPSVFVNSQPMREEQVQNAVKFLSHPKVRGSPVMYRRSFLEKKGLTKEEIDEAFRRVPDSAPTVQTGGVNQGEVSNIEVFLCNCGSSQIACEICLTSFLISLIGIAWPVSPASTVVKTSSGTLPRSRFHWSHALIAVGLLAASGAGTAIIIKKSFLPRLKSWIRKVVLDNDDEQLKKTDNKPTLMEEAAQAAKSAAAAAEEVAKASQEILASKGEERRYFVEVVSLLDKQVQEMKSMTNAIRRLEVRSSSPPASVQPSSGLHPKSYMEVQNTSTQILQSQVNGEDLNTKTQDTSIVNGDDPLPWWQRKNVRITEIENENESNGVPYAASQLPVQRVWVPPQPPPIAMPGAAEAIRRPKQVAQKEQKSDNQSLAQSSDSSDDVQGVSKPLESGGAVEGSSVSSVPSSSEIQEEHEVQYDEK